MFSACMSKVKVKGSKLQLGREVGKQKAEEREEMGRATGKPSGGYSRP